MLLNTERQAPQRQLEIVQRRGHQDGESRFVLKTPGAPVTRARDGRAMRDAACRLFSMVPITRCPICPFVHTFGHMYSTREQEKEQRSSIIAS